MSVQFTFEESALELDAWDEVLRTWSGGLEEPLFDEPCFVREQAQLLGPGSIRGVLLWREGARIQLRLNALASRADWRMAYAVARVGLEEGGGVLAREDGRRLEAKDLTPERADADAVEDFCFVSRAVQESLKEGNATLPIAAWALVLRPGDLPICADAAQVAAAEGPLAARVARYAAAYVPSVMVLVNDVRLTTWAQIPSIIGRAHVVAIEGLDAPVPLERALALLGDRAEDVGDGLWYFPELEAERDRALLTALRAESVELERWADANKERLEADAAAAAERGQGAQAEPEGDPFAPIRDLARRIVSGMVARKGPDELRRELVRQGHPADTVDVVFMVLSRALEAFQGPQPPTPPEALDALVEEGVPAPLAEAVLLALLEGAEQSGL